MKRASYKEAIDWIAQNDSAGDSDALDETVASELITAVLVADIFDVTPEKVGKDIVKRRKIIQWNDGKKSEQCAT